MDCNQLELRNKMERLIRKRDLKDKNNGNNN